MNVDAGRDKKGPATDTEGCSRPLMQSPAARFSGLTTQETPRRRAFHPDRAAYRRNTQEGREFHSSDSTRGGVRPTSTRNLAKPARGAATRRREQPLTCVRRVPPCALGGPSRKPGQGEVPPIHQTSGGAALASSITFATGQGMWHPSPMLPPALDTQGIMGDPPRHG
jgi:hypothetical protein